jgi:threonine dehydratase
MIGVEPAGAPKMTASRKAGHPVTLDATKSIADGLLAVRPGELTFLHAQQFVDDIVTVDEAAIVRATRWLVERAHLVVEPSGAVTTGAVLEGFVDGPPPVVAIVSGGNVSLSSLAALAADHG